MELVSDETELKGAWKLVDGRMRGDDVEERISWLVTHSLKPLASASGGWEILYLDPNDGRYWERTFLHGELQGGGPQCLRVLDQIAASRKYSLDQLTNT